MGKRGRDGMGRKWEEETGGIARGKAVMMEETQAQGPLQCATFPNISCPSHPVCVWASEVEPFPSQVGRGHVHGWKRRMLILIREGEWENGRLKGTD